MKRYSPYSFIDYGDVTASGKNYRLDEMHETKVAAIAHGRAECTRLRADLDKREGDLLKRISNLNKAEE